MYKFDIITLFPNIIEPYFKESIMKIAIEKKAIQINFWNPRDFSENKHKNVDDTPYGGGAGMVLTPQPTYDCIMAAKKQNSGKVVFMTPTGEKLAQAKAEAFACAELQSLIIVCGRYEGLDQRVIDLCVDEELSIGDYVLSGGELPALVLIESITRLLNGVLGNQESHETDSFSADLDRKKQYPVYTKPALFKGLEVPDILKSGNHAAIENWRKDNLR
jgi:tRNA (guanine37-N1)-methyltransferase